MNLKTRSRFPVLFLATLGAILLLQSATPEVNCSLAAYSETRSFRDALDGRSMEEALSGPVDNDTSSYGDRAGNSGSASASNSNGQSGASAPMMPLNIPANGNLNNDNDGQQQQMDQPEQQQKPASDSLASGDELEREAEPKDEQQRARLVNGMRLVSRRVMNAKKIRSGRLTQQTDEQSLGEASFGKESNEAAFGPSRSNGNSDSVSKTAKGRRITMMASGYGLSNDNGARNSPLNGGYASQGAQAPASDGEQQEDKTNAGSTKQQPQQDDSNGEPDNNEQQQERADRLMLENMMSSMMPRTNGKVQEMSNDGGYDNEGLGNVRSAKAKQMAAIKAMQMMAIMMSEKQKNGANGEISAPSSMAQNMRMSLASKAAYANGQQQAKMMNGRQMAPPMMMNNGYGQQQSPASTTESVAGNGPQNLYGMPMMANGLNGISNGNSYSSMISTGGGAMGSRLMYNGRGGMRRANQRKQEKKMSPAMVNAMLNSMLGRQTSGNADYQTQNQTNSMGMTSVMTTNGRYQAAASGASEPGFGKLITSSVMAQMMKSSQGQEMLADMMMANGLANGYKSNGGQQTTESEQMANKEQYKRMLMKAMIEQQRQEQEDSAIAAGNGDEEPQQQIGSNYGDRQQQVQMPMSRVMVTKATRAPSGKQRLGLMNPMMRPAMYEAEQKGMQQMRSIQQQQQQPASDNMAIYGQPKMANGEGMPDQQGQQQQQEQNYDSNADNNQQQVMTEQRRDQSSTKSPASDSNMLSSGGSKNAYGRANGAMMRPTMSMSYGSRRANASPVGLAGMTKTMIADQQSTQQQVSGDSYGSLGMNGEQKKQQMLARAMALMMMMQNGNGQQSLQSDQAYGEQQQQMQPNRVMPMDSREQSYGADQAKASKGRERQQELGEGTKSAESTTMDGNGPSSSQKYASEGQTKGNSNGIDEQQRRDNEYGAAPAGQAEPFAFKYNIDDNYGNQQYRKEESDNNGVVRGSYGYMDMSGIYRHVQYVADENGFRAKIKSNEPGLNGSDGNSNSVGLSSPSGSMMQQQQQPQDSETDKASPQTQPDAPPSTSSSLGGSTTA